MGKLGMRKVSSEVQSVTRTWHLAEFAGRKVRPGLRWMALAALLSLAPVGGTMAVGLSDVSAHGHVQATTQGDASPSGEDLHVRKSGGDQQEYVTVRKSGGDQQEYQGMRKAGGDKEIIAI
jgi:hypothetical protein